jgi:hypothetical protein
MMRFVRSFVCLVFGCVALVSHVRQSVAGPADWSLLRNGIETATSKFGACDSGHFIPAFTKHSIDSSTAAGEYGNNPAVRHRPQIDWGRFWIADGILAASIGLLHVYQANSWWKDQRIKFHVIDDVDYKANFDKFGHTFGAYYAAHFLMRRLTGVVSTRRNRMHLVRPVGRSGSFISRSRMVLPATGASRAAMR